MDMEAQLDAVVQRAIEDRRIVGAVLVVRRNGELLYQKAQGLADREAGRAMTLDAILDAMLAATRPADVPAEKLCAQVVRRRLRGCWRGAVCSWR